MGLFTKDSIDRVRDVVDMVALVGTKTDLRRVGSQWMGPCPFHDERTPSFSMNAEKKVFYCFGCQAKGDVIDFVQQAEGLDFPGAVELLADRFGVQLEREQDDPAVEARRRHRERLLALLERTSRFYATYLWESAEAAPAREYLASRGLGEEVLREFAVGYAPSAWDRVIVAAQRDGARPEELVAAGLAQANRDGRLYDRFRGRIMFPLADSRGRVLGFGARAMADGRGPKYLNSSENEVYKKGHQLFGLHLARSHAAKAGRMVVVEGYTDVLALHQAGIRETVAIMGTAITPPQIAEMARVAPDVILALDADRAGQEAMLRAVRVAEASGVQLRAVMMPEGRDPADLLETEGADAVQARLADALAMIQFQVRRLLADANLDTPAGRDRALDEARTVIAAAPQRSAMRDELVRDVANALDVPEEYVTAAAAGAASRAPTHAAAARPGNGSAPALPAGGSAGELAFRAEREFLARCLASGELGRDLLGRVSDDQLSTDPMRKARRHLLEHFDDPLVGLSEDDPAHAALVMQVTHAAQEMPRSTEAVLRMSILQLEKRSIEREIRRAGQEGDHARQLELAQAEQRVRADMDEVMGQTE